MDEEKVTGVYTDIEVRSKWVKYFYFNGAIPLIHLKAIVDSEFFFKHLMNFFRVWH